MFKVKVILTVTDEAFEGWMKMRADKGLSLSENAVVMGKELKSDVKEAAEKFLAECLQAYIDDATEEQIAEYLK